MATTIRTLVINSLDCPRCGIGFGISDDYEARRREDKTGFYCPNGHSMSYHESRADRLARELATEKGRVAQLHDDVQYQIAERQRVQTQLTVKKRQLTITKKRALAGVCPVCNRQFTQVAEHVAEKHPAEAQDIGVKTKRRAGPKKAAQ